MEWIKYHEAEKVFDLRTEHSTYQMQVREYDTLVHLYYGSPVGDALITDRIVCVDRGFSGNPYEAEKDRTFSLDTLPQEYTAYGNGDYRINGQETEQADGSDTANLKFESYEITKGKYSLKGLPAMFAKEDVIKNPILGKLYNTNTFERFLFLDENRKIICKNIR